LEAAAAAAAARIEGDTFGDDDFGLASPILLLFFSLFSAAAVAVAVDSLTGSPPLERSEPDELAGVLGGAAVPDFCCFPFIYYYYYYYYYLEGKEGKERRARFWLDDIQTDSYFGFCYRQSGFNSCHVHNGLND
jgi:hypothetical protein